MNLKKWLVATLACGTLALTACGGGSQNQASPAGEANGSGETKTFVVGTNAQFAPFESKGANGSLVGFDIDLMNAMAKAGGFRITFKDQRWESLFAGLANGDMDMLISGVTINAERKQSMDFSDPYFDIMQVVLLPKGTTIHSLADLKKMNRIGVAAGQTGDFTAQKLLGATSQKIARFDAVPLVLKELENSGVDAVISDNAVVANYLKNNGNKGFTMVNVPDIAVEHYGVAVRKNDAATVKILNAALKKVRASGEYDRIYSRYFAK